MQYGVVRKEKGGEGERRGEEKKKWRWRTGEKMGVGCISCGDKCLVHFQLQLGKPIVKNNQVDSR